MPASIHEHLAHSEPEEIGSDRSFGLVMAGVCIVIAAFKLWFGGLWWPWTMGAGALAAIAFAAPSRLAPFNRLWFRFGLLLHRVVSPLTMGAIFFGAVLPTGLLLRLFGADPLHLKFDRAANSYWRARDNSGPGSMKKQY
ncbi:MAG: hypothetical protein HC829_03555 [Bacteroidales bacterium]|nr:hypothetical protein [Candidatus Methylacidiphilales bacterium]NJO54025.1 hypothetical protein [Bacteroidales bacterium]